MAEKLCTLRTKGGGGGATYTETVLWQNPSPSSDFNGQTVTLSDNISNYEYLAIAFTGVKSSTTVVRAVVSVEDLGKMNITSNTPDIRINGTASANGYSRYVIKASDTTITFGAAYATNTQALDNSRAIPIQIVGISEGRVPSYKTVKDFIHAKVFDSGLPEIDTYTVYSNRATVTEGKVVADAVTHKVYMYFDFTTNSALGSASDWASILTFTSAITNYLPVFVTNSRANNIPLITDDLSDIPTKQFACGYGTSSYPYKLFLPYGSTAQANEHYIVYAEYTYK